jgi:hypothetical protein
VPKNLTIPKLTRLIYHKHTHKPPNVIAKWEARFPPNPDTHTPPLDWPKISKVYSTAFLTPKDFHLHSGTFFIEASSPVSGFQPMIPPAASAPRIQKAPPT